MWHYKETRKFKRNLTYKHAFFTVELILPDSHKDREHLSVCLFISLYDRSQTPS